MRVIGLIAPSVSSNGRPLSIRNSWSTVMARCGSVGERQAGIGAGWSSRSLPSRTRMPIRALTTDFVSEWAQMGVSGP